MDHHVRVRGGKSGHLRLGHVCVAGEDQKIRAENTDQRKAAKDVDKFQSIGGYHLVVSLTMTCSRGAANRITE